MKILAIAATVAITAVVGTASARSIEVPTGTVVPVCVQTVISRQWASLILARGVASKIFGAADITIDWRSWNACPADGIRVSLSQRAPENLHPNAYAYALPYEGTHIVLFWDRVVSAADARDTPYLLGHVLAHEVTHILQGVPRHSQTGIMKAVYGTADIGEMEFHSLPFTEEDVALIHKGIEARQASLTQN